jgi:site-specific DNA recombinase
MKQNERQIARRCAIYTRVSTDSGLEQDFNSLDNQREASEAYIKSQAQEGWNAVRERYDDGGFSGGSIERPALQKLMDDVRARKIDVIVVYKVDRLTRSLADFAKLVELFDAHGVSFISVTQAFNTTTSMGRLTLNMLLSFAQFEREITGERIRDKVAASKRKGIWMGGTVPLGYRVENRALHVVESEAEFVRVLYHRYLELGSVVRLKVALDGEIVRSPARTSKSGKATGGAPISRGHLYWILSNPIYVGRLRHKGQIHDGLHPAIVDIDIWERLQQRRKSQTQTRRTSSQEDLSFLAGKFFDDCGNRMGASHASRGARRWRYYVSRAALSGRKQQAGSIVRIPAAEIENRVATAVGAHFSTQRPGKAVDDCQIEGPEGRGDHTIAQHEQTRGLHRNEPTDAAVRAAIDRVTVGATQIEIVLSESVVAEGQDRVLTLPWTRASSRRRREIIQGAGEAQQPVRAMRTKARGGFVKTLRDAHLWLGKLLSDPTQTIETLAASAGKTERSIRAPRSTRHATAR